MAAIGVIAAQLDIDTTTAFLHLRARAFVTGRPLSLLAEEVLTGLISFTDDEGFPRPR